MTAPAPSQENVSPVPGFNVSEENKFKGTLVIEAFDGLITSINEKAESATEDALDMAFSAIGAASSVVEFIADPIAGTIGAIVGWLLEHFEPLSRLLDMLSGNPQSVMQKADDTKAQAAELRVLAEDHKKTMATFTGWSGNSADAYQQSMIGLGIELNKTADATESKAKILGIAGVIISVARDMFRDMIAQGVGAAASAGINAAVTAGSGGTSAGVTIPQAAKAIAQAGALIGKATAFVGKVGKGLDKLAGLMGELQDALKMLSKAWERFENGADVAEISYESYKQYAAVEQEIEDALAKDAKNDAAKATADADLANVNTLGGAATTANAAYSAAKDGEALAAKEAQAAGDVLGTEAAQANAAGAAAQKAANEASALAAETEAAGKAAEAAAKRGDKDAFNEARDEYEAKKKAFDAANDRFEDAQAFAKKEQGDVNTAAQSFAKETQDVADWAAYSSQKLAESEAPQEAAEQASKNFQASYGAGLFDGGLMGLPFNAIDKAAQEYSNAALDAAQSDQKAAEAANLDFAQKNAAAAAASAKAMESGSDADRAAADAAATTAKTSGEAAQAAGQKAQVSGETAKNTFDTSKELSDVAQSVNKAARGEQTREETPLPA